MVLNAGFELARAFLQMQMGESVFHISGTDYNFSKKNKWQTDLALLLETDQATMDDFFISLQKKKKTEITFPIKIQIDGSKKIDHLQLTLHIEKIDLIA